MGQFDDLDMKVPMTLIDRALKHHLEYDVVERLGETVYTETREDDSSFQDIGVQLIENYRGATDEQREAMQATLLILTGLTFESLVRATLSGRSWRIVDGKDNVLESALTQDEAGQKLTRYLNENVHAYLQNVAEFADEN